MNRKSDIFIILLSLFTLIFILTNNKITIESVNFSISLWKDNLFPTLFPFFIISNILIDYNFPRIIGKIFKKPFTRLFKLNEECSFVLINSLISGTPSGAKITTDLVTKEIITKEEGNKLLTFTHYSNPLFIIGFIGSIILNNQIVAYIILVSHIISGMLVGIIFNYKNKVINKKSINGYSKKPIGTVIKNSIDNSLNTMFLLLGIVTLFTILTSLIDNILNLNSLNSLIVSGILEMTQGIKNVNNLNLSIYLKTVLITFFISFGGLSIHMQVLSIISEAKLKYKYYFLARIIHSILSIILVSILYFIFIN